MENQLTQQDSLIQIQTGLQQFEARKAKLEELVKAASEIKLEDWKDKKQLKVVSEKRKELKTERVQVTKEGKAMRDMITPVTKHILAKEKELVDILSPEEERLESIEAWAQEEQEAVRLAELEKENQRIQARIDKLAEFGFTIDYSDIKQMDDDVFAQYLETAKAQFEKEKAEKEEQERIQKEQEEQARLEREAEEKRIAAEREELAKLRKEQQEREAKIREQQDAIDAENRRIEQQKIDEENARIAAENKAKHEQEIKDAQEKAAEEARLKAIEDAKEAERLKQEQLEKERIAAERKAARQPDKVKIEAYINAIISVPVPEMKTDEGMSVLASILELRGKLEGYAKGKTNEL